MWGAQGAPAGRERVCTAALPAQEATAEDVAAALPWQPSDLQPTSLPSGKCIRLWPQEHCGSNLHLTEGSTAMLPGKTFPNPSPSPR